MVVRTDRTRRGGRRDHNAADRPHLYAAVAIPLQKTGSVSFELHHGRRQWRHSTGRPDIERQSRSGDGGAETTGGAQFPAVVLYDDRLHKLAELHARRGGQCSFLGSIASFRVDASRRGVLVGSTATGSAAATQRLRSSARTSRQSSLLPDALSFYPGNVPTSGTLIRVHYRIGGRAVARMIVPASSPTSSLILTAEHPVTRTSADCENARPGSARDVHLGRSIVERKPSCWNVHQTADVWPGHLLDVEVPSAECRTELLVRSVQIRATSCIPELLSYAITFANEWARTLHEDEDERSVECVRYLRSH